MASANPDMEAGVEVNGDLAVHDLEARDLGDKVTNGMADNPPESACSSLGVLDADILDLGVLSIDGAAADHGDEGSWCVNTANDS